MADEPVKKKKGRKRNYINNPELHEAMAKYIAAVTENPKARIPRYVCEAISEIVRRYSCSPNFINYPFKDEMIGDAVETCFLRIKNYNPNAKVVRGPKIGEPSQNPLAYFTQISHNAFINRINLEKKQRDIKLKIALDSGVDLESLKEGRHLLEMTEEQMEAYINSHYEKKPEKKRSYNGSTLITFFL